MRKALLMAAVTAALLASVAYAGNGVGTATSSASLAAGALNLQGALQLISDPIECPPDVPPGAVDCRARTGKGLLPGLGGLRRSTPMYRLGPPTCPADFGIPLATTGRLIVEGKGEIRFAPRGRSCAPRRGPPHPARAPKLHDHGRHWYPMTGHPGAERWNVTVVPMRPRRGRGRLRRPGSSSTLRRPR